MSKTARMLEICFICGDSVAWGSGKFVNRIPAYREPDERDAYICDECDSNFYAENGQHFDE